jgi:hypothetical protein
MGGVEHHRAAGFAHDRQAAHVGDEVVVAERGSALTDHDHVFVYPGSLGGVARLVDDILHVVRSHELRLLDVDRLAAGRDRMDEIRLAGEEGRRLQHVDHFRDRLNLRNVVDVCQYRHAKLVADLGEDLQTLVYARTAEALSDERLALSKLDLKKNKCRACR